jgi:hypothetical protein
LVPAVIISLDRKLVATQGRVYRPIKIDSTNVADQLRDEKNVVSDEEDRKKEHAFRQFSAFFLKLIGLTY